MISVFFLVLFCVACNTVPENWHICVQYRSYLLFLINLKGRFVLIAIGSVGSSTTVTLRREEKEGKLAKLNDYRFTNVQHIL